MNEKIGRCHDCTAPQTEVNMLSRHILELQADKGRLTDKLTKAKEIIKTFLGFAEAFGYSPSMDKFISEAEQFLIEVEK